ncbi:CheY-like chemotaxis protein [Desulfobaculum xiamenense]|uniref:CheY-like chemotaxis protein n=1 Tax=Desulfobaculum xiamenense TaxID=995050 RepID=A0A846QL72_9BACT|nr:response regulator [Desulfobaculum xiamenense]NJB67800.1 CheY-like chemotaxis protein [Desulfobaculum xiamenense]
MRLLVVGEDAALAADFAERLTRLGVHVDGAADPRQALTLARMIRYDVALIAGDMPSVRRADMVKGLRGLQPTLCVISLGEARCGGHEIPECECLAPRAYRLLSLIGAALEDQAAFPAAIPA